ncbi:MAG: hypothetical protein KDI46_02115 [Alphaproteobacteria bacterium]|nr:hypothetical protein [Alphaproteobacteria bacterium]
MGIKHHALVTTLALTILCGSIAAHAKSCVENQECMFQTIANEAAKIDNQSWRDQTYRELAKSMAAAGLVQEAIPYIEKIQTPDTKAMTIRGIGMAAAQLGLSPEQYAALFTTLRAEAEKITHPPSYAIALTYIAMSQAFAGDNAGAWKTASDMENDALRHKAYGETAEIQAGKGNTQAAMKSIGLIESEAYRNKSYSIVCKILTDNAKQDLDYQKAFDFADAITNPYKKAEAMQYIVIARQTQAAEAHKSLKENGITN